MVELDVVVGATVVVVELDVVVGATVVVVVGATVVVAVVVVVVGAATVMVVRATSERRRASVTRTATRREVPAVNVTDAVAPVSSSN